MNPMDRSMDLDYSVGYQIQYNILYFICVIAKQKWFENENDVWWWLIDAEWKMEKEEEKKWLPVLGGPVKYF